MDDNSGKALLVNRSARGKRIFLFESGGQVSGTPARDRTTNVK
jgi:hypothetical protein